MTNPPAPLDESASLAPPVVELPPLAVPPEEPPPGEPPPPPSSVGEADFARPIQSSMFSRP
jgi:hypothetical protein